MNEFNNNIEEIKSITLNNAIPADGMINNEYNRYYIARILRDMANKLDEGKNLPDNYVDKAILGLIKHKNIYENI